MFKKKLSDEIKRIIAAFGFAFEGLKWLTREEAFRTELAVTAIMAPLGLILAQNGVERALLIGSLILVLIVEALNTGIETAIDRISTDIHPLSKAAKDVASTAVLLSLVNAGAIWFFIVFT